MKKSILLALALLISLNVFSQYSAPIEFLHSNYGYGYGSKIYYVDEGMGVTSFRIAVRGGSTIFSDALYIRASDGAAPNGFIGIGNTNPSELLTIGIEDGTNSLARKAIQIGSGGYGEPSSFGTASNGDKLILYNSSPAQYDGRVGVGSRQNLWFKSFGSAINSGTIEWYTGQNSIPRMTLTGSGALSIGTTDPKGYMLAVAGSAIATSITVKTVDNWPDYVFKPTYTLPSLPSIKSYIEQNHHLPDMPSEEDVKNKGIDLGEMVKLQTKKIEELTLYLIEKDKQITELNKKVVLVDQQATKNAEQQKKIDELEAKLNILLESLPKDK